ncbi:hypothetical protein LCGC14_1283830 [marine sediment metagenome]|uniref:Uncharacterized protein n=1 Tax=marine sediment metagenome TaxID=412755 RepID=A0A0F9KUF9_9ZZZZ
MKKDIKIKFVEKELVSIKFTQINRNITADLAGDVTGSPTANSVVKIRGKAIAAPTASDDAKSIIYDLTTDTFIYAASGGVAAHEITYDHSQLHTHANKTLLDTYTQTEVNLASAVSLKHAEAHTIVSHSDTTATGAQLNTLVAGGNTSLHTHDIYALDTDLSTHESDTTSIHGITDTSDLALKSGNINQFADIASAGADIESAVTLKHTQNSDTVLDSGQPNEVTAADIRTHLDLSHYSSSDFDTDFGSKNIEDLSNVAFDSGTPSDLDVLTYDSGTGKWKSVPPAAGAEINLSLKPQQAKLPSSNPARIDGGENNWRLLFDATTDESATWEFILDDDYGAGVLYVDVYFTMASTQTGVNDITWEAYVMKLTPNSDAADIDSDSYDTVNYIQHTLANNQTEGYLRIATITLTNKDSLSAGDYLRIKIARDANGTNGTDDATSDAEMVMAIIRE